MGLYPEGVGVVMNKKVTILKIFPVLLEKSRNAYNLYLPEKKFLLDSSPNKNTMLWPNQFHLQVMAHFNKMTTKFAHSNQYYMSSIYAKKRPQEATIMDKSLGTNLHF